MEEFATRRMGLACYLRHSGHRLLGTDWESGQGTWRFERTPRLDGDAAHYDEGRALVDARAYWHAVAEFKRMTWESRGGRE